MGNAQWSALVFPSTSLCNKLQSAEHLEQGGSCVRTSALYLHQRLQGLGLYEDGDGIELGHL